MSPSLVIKAGEYSYRVLHILLRFLPHVEDGTIFASTQDILMQRTLTSLTLRPEPCILNLVRWCIRHLMDDIKASLKNFGDCSPVSDIIRPVEADNCCTPRHLYWDKNIAVFSFCKILTFYAIIRFKRSLTSKAGNGLDGKLHQSTNRRRSDLYGPRMIAGHCEYCQ